MLISWLWLTVADKKVRTLDRFRIYKYVGMHTCGVENATRRHKKISSELIASVCVNHFRDGKGPSIREIQIIVFKELRCNASYWMCWKGSVIAKNIICGTPEHGYACLPAFSHNVELLNPGYSYSIMVNRMDGSFIYYFLAFGACRRGYDHIRKVSVVDDTYLYGKYGGVLLSAVAQDTENHIFLIAFCVVDKENDASWTFFFQKLKSIIEDETDQCVISDRHISIANDFSCIYSRAHHGLCMRHLAESLRLKQHCGEHLYLFYAAGKAYSFDEFSDNFVELKSKFLEAAHVLENVLDFKKWSRAHFPGNRYDVMTTNITESLNSILMDEREYPVSYIFNSIAKKFGENFRERHAFVGGKENIFVSFAERILRDNKSASDSLYVGNLNGVLEGYTVFGNDVTAKVNLFERSCSCRKFDLVKMPCEHAMAALRAKNDDGEDYGNSIYDYSSSIYKDESYLLAYLEAINVVPPEAEWTVPQELIDTKIFPPPYDPKLGRKKVKRTKGVGETFKSKSRNRCSICKKFGHKRITYRMGIKS